MKFEPALKKGILLRRYKRFLADVRLKNGRVRTMHCANTGAMLGCDEPGNVAYFSTHNNPSRKYAHTLELVRTQDQHLICVNTLQANRVVAEALRNCRVSQLVDAGDLTAEYRLDQFRTRFDFGDGKTFVEVKSVTYLRDGIGVFPDAPSVRARRHVSAMHDLVRDGHRCVLLFCALHTGIREVTLAHDIDPMYHEAVMAALEAGAEVLAYGCRVSPTEIEVVNELPFTLPCAQTPCATDDKR